MDTQESRTDQSSQAERNEYIPAVLQTRAFGAGFAFLTWLFLLFYVFVFTDYQNYLFSDMGGFWARALERLNGNPFGISQYWAWPPGYHIFLAELFRLLRWMGLESLIRVETALSINMTLYALSVYAMQRIACRWFDKPQWIFVLLLLYGFGFSAWYFNSFLLSGNMAIPLLVMATALIYCSGKWRSIIFSAMLFAFASVIRPSIAPFGLAFVIFFFVQKRFSRQFIARAAVFSAVFFTLIFCASLEVSRISHGKVNGLSANGGLDFFIANSRYHRIDLNYKGYHNCIVVPALTDNPENGYFRSNVPYFNQSYYFRKGWDFIRHDPSLLIKNVVHIRDLFYAPMMPSVEIPGARIFLSAWNIFKIIMALTLGLYIWLWRSLSPEKRSFFGFLMSVMILTLAVSYLFTGEPRYTYQIIFVFYLLFLKLAEQLLSQWHRFWKVCLTYVLTAACVTGIFAAAVIMMKPDYPASIKMQVQTKVDEKGGAVPVVQNVGRLFFPYVYCGTAKHADTGYKLKVPTRVSAQTVIDIPGDKPLPLKFDIYSVWAYEIRIDNIRLIAQNPAELKSAGGDFDPNVFVEFDEDGTAPCTASANGTDSETDFEEFAATSPDPESYIKRNAYITPDPDLYVEQNAYATLKPGRHTIDIIFNSVPGEGGFAISYNYFDHERWRHRHMLGISDELIRFSLPEAAGGS